MNVADHFIRATLNGDFNTAEKYLVQDQKNKDLFYNYKNYYSSLADSVKRNYRVASYEIISIQDVNDSTSNVTFKNTYMNTPMEITLLWKNDQWLVDFANSEKAPN